MNETITICKGAYSREIITTEINWKEVLDNPLNMPKDNAPFWFPYNFSNDQALKKDCIEMTHFVLDIDSDANSLIEKCINDLKIKDLEFYLYTSKSATLKNMKFRIILPLEKAIPISQLEDYSILGEWTMMEFPYTDKDVAYRFGGFYLPNKGDVYYSYINKGNKFEMEGWDTFYKVKRRNNLIMGTVASMKHAKNLKKYKNRKQIDDMQTWIKCNKSGCLKDFLENHSAAGYVSGGENLLYDVLCSAYTLNVCETLIDEIHTIQKRWDNSAKNTSKRWEYLNKQAKKS